MSLAHYAVLFGDPPSVEVLNAELASFGGVEGSWPGAIVCAGVSASVVPVAAVEALLAQVLGGDATRVKTVVELDGRGGDALFALGEALIATAGGAVMAEDGERFAYVRHAKRARATAAPATPAIDGSVPDEVQRWFRAKQTPFLVAARNDVTATFSAVLKAIGARPSNVAHPKWGGWDEAAIGDVVLSERRSTGAPSVYAVDFRYWHLTSVPDWDWNAMLAVMCALGRLSGGVMHRDGDSYDFASPPKADESLRLDWREPGNGPRLKAGNRIKLRYVVRDAAGQELSSSSVFRPAELDLGRGEANPLLLRVLEGARVGCKVIAHVPAQPAAGAVPPTPGDTPFVLELEVIERLD